MGEAKIRKMSDDYEPLSLMSSHPAEGAEREEPTIPLETSKGNGSEQPTQLFSDLRGPTSPTWMQKRRNISNVGTQGPQEQRE